MLINRVALKLLAAPDLAPVLHQLDSGHDATLGVAPVRCLRRLCGRATPGRA